MIKIEVDEAEAYDRLSILWVKANKSPELAGNYNELDQVMRYLLSSPVHNKILESEEFENMKSINLKLFNRIDEIKQRRFNIFKRILDAEFIDDLNYKRYLAKRRVQEKFFPKQRWLKEQKIGY